MEMVYKHTPDMGEISGFGGVYEAQCQTMLAAGVRYCLDQTSFDPKFDSIENVCGIIMPTNEDGEALYNAVLDAVDKNCTGAMLEAVLKRVMYINKHGWEDYCHELRTHPDEEEAPPHEDPDFPVPVAEND